MAVQNECQRHAGLSQDGIFRSSNTNIAHVLRMFYVPVQGAQRRSEKGRQGVVPISIMGLASRYVGRGCPALFFEEIFIDAPDILSLIPLHLSESEVV